MDVKQPLETAIESERQKDNETKLCDCSGLRRGFIRKCCGWYLKLSDWKYCKENCTLSCNEKFASTLNMEVGSDYKNDINYQIDLFPVLMLDMYDSIIYAACSRDIADFLTKWTINLEKGKDDKVHEFVVNMVNIILFTLVVGLYLMAGGILWDSWGNLPFSLMAVLYELLILSMYNRKALEYLFFNFEVWFKTINACVMMVTLIIARDGNFSENTDPIFCKNIFQIIIVTLLIFMMSVVDGLKIKRVTKIFVLGVLIGYFCAIYYMVYYKTAEAFGINKDKNPVIYIFGASFNVRETCLSNTLNIIVFLIKQLWDTLNSTKANVISVGPKIEMIKRSRM